MEAPMKLGTSVRQVIKPIEGLTVDTRFNAMSMQFEYLVQYDEGAHTCTRWFTSSEVADATPKEELAQ
jgi:hypothetical protein